MFSINRRNALFFVLVLIPPFSIAYFVLYYGLTVPFWDQWELVPLLYKMHSGELSFSDIWAQHNEHRIFFPRSIMLTLAYLTDWNIIYELYTNLVIAALTLFFLFILLRQTFSNHNCAAAKGLFIISSFLIFSPIQWENWSWGWQVQIFLCVLGAVAAVWSINRWPGQLKGVLGGIGAAVLASYSFNNGLLTWIVIGILLLMQGDRKWRHIVLWTAALAVTIAFYYYGYTKPAQHPSPLFFLNHPYDFIRYVLAYLGAPLGFGKKDISISIGLLFMIVLCTTAIRICRSHKEEFNRLLPWLAIASYAILSAVVTGIGRVGFGVGQALSSRYTTISTLFIISVLVIVVIWANNYIRIYKQLPTKWVVIITSISTLLVLSYILSFSKGKEEFAQRKAHLEKAAACFENVDVVTDEFLRVLYPNTAIVRERIKMLSKMGLLKKKGVEWQKIKRVKGGLMCIDLINSQLYSPLQQKVIIDSIKDKSLTINGWAVDDVNKNSGDRVYIVFRYNSEEIIVPTVRQSRPDVAKHFGEDRYMQSGWIANLSLDNFKKGCYTFSIRILRGNKKEYFELDGDKQVCFVRAR